jgi:hypothetical protein
VAGKKPAPAPTSWGDTLEVTGIPEGTSHGLIDDANWAMTGGVCVNASFQLGVLGVAGGCIVVDGGGFGWTGSVKDGVGPASGVNLSLEGMLSTADRMEDLRGPQLFGAVSAGEVVTVGAEVDSGQDLTLQVGGGVGANVGSAGPVSGGGGVVITGVDRWDWASWE